MPSSLALRRRIEQDAKSPDYWYVPKGEAVYSRNWGMIAKRLKVLHEVEAMPWREAQARLERELRRRKLIEPYLEGFSAVARMQFPVWRLLGLAWINTNNEPETTAVGREFIEASNDRRRDLLLMQLHRFQFSNPSLGGSHFARFRAFPVLALYRLLSQTGWKLSETELKLFGTRIRSFADADSLAPLVEEWRLLGSEDRKHLLAVAKTLPAASHTKSLEGTTWRKIENQQAYLYALLEILRTVQISGDRTILVPQGRRGEVQRLVISAAETAEFIDYETEQDWLAVYGGMPVRDSRYPWTTANEARAYYERVGRVDAATEAFSKETKSRPAEVEQYRTIQVQERVLEDLLEHNLEALEPGLKLLGRQFSTAVGPIDLLAKDVEGIYVVIELKRGRSSDRVVGQIARYITWVEERLARGEKIRVRGIIVGRDFDKQFAAAIAQLKRVKPYTFDLRVSFEPWVRSSTAGA